MEVSIFHPILFAIKTKSPYLSCSQYRLCPFMSHGGFSNPSLMKRDSKRKKNRRCTYNSCLEQSSIIKHTIDEEWVKPLAETRLFDDLKERDVKIDGNIFIFNKESIEFCLDAGDEILDNMDELARKAVADFAYNVFFIFVGEFYLLFYFSSDRISSVVFVKTAVASVSVFNIGSGVVCDNPSHKEIHLRNICNALIFCRDAKYKRQDCVKIPVGSIVDTIGLSKYYNDSSYDLLFN